MRKLRWRILLSAITVLATLVAVIAPGCQDPTQVTLELTLDSKAKCEEIAVGGTAISVGVEPQETENEVTGGFVSAKTNACDPSTNTIGTLVITPSDDSNKAAVIVIVGYKGKDPTTCRSPFYEGCIVARRRFVFAEHTRLRMPIKIDPDCANVPCDAFTTCNRGTCVDSETKCSDSECETPGTLPDGGFDEASIVVDANPFNPDAPINAGGEGGTTDAGRDAEGGSDSDGGGSVLGSFCTGTVLSCRSQNGPCPPTGPSCCAGQCGLQNSCAPNTQLCCVPGVTSECSQSQRCERSQAAQANGTPGVCVPNTVSPPVCNGADQVVCGSGQTCVPGANPVCCGPTSQFCQPVCTIPIEQHCCVNAQCTQANHVCKDRNGPTPGRCQPVIVPTNDGGVDGGI